MARLYQGVQPQQQFETPKPYQPSAEGLAQVDDTFKKAIAGRVNTDFSGLSSQYENKQISDQDFASGVELLVGRIPDPALKQQWEPAIAETKYLVLSNAQSLTDAKIQTDLNTGALTPQGAIDRYNEMAKASLDFNSQTSLQDAAAWSLKASAIDAAMRKGSGSGSRGPGKEPKDMSDLVRKYEEKTFLLDQTRSFFQNDLETIDGYVQAGQMTPEQAMLVKKAKTQEFYDELTGFGYDADVLDYIKEVDSNGGYAYLNDQLDFAKKFNFGLTTPGYYSGYEEGLNLNSEQQNQAEKEFKEANNIPSLSDVLNNLFGASSTEQQPQEQPVKETPEQPTAGAPPAPLVSQEAQRRSNPLGLGTGGSGRRGLV